MENLVVLPPDVRAELASRGSVYAGFASSAAFLEYAPGSFLPVPRAGTASRAPARSRGGGRVMVDAQAAWARGVHCARSEGVASDAVKGVLKLVAQRARTEAAGGGAAGPGGAAGSGQLAAAAEEESLELLLLPSPLPPSLAVLTWPVVAGFSFHTKSWGVVLVAGLRPVAFNEEAFRRLVMPEARKTLIEALVLSHRGGSARENTPHGAKKATHVDVIAGKGGAWCGHHSARRMATQLAAPTQRAPSSCCTAPLASARRSRLRPSPSCSTSPSTSCPWASSARRPRCVGLPWWCPWASARGALAAPVTKGRGAPVDRDCLRGV